MSVNTLSFEDAAAILNNIRKQVTGESAIAPLTTADFVSVATTVLNAGYEPVLAAITQMVSSTIFSIRPYYRKFGGIKMDQEQWGAIVRKLSIADKDFEVDDRYSLVDGQSIDMYKVNKPNVLQTNYYGFTHWSKTMTTFRDQLDSAFSGPGEFGRFMAMVTQNIADMIEQSFESVARMTIGNFIGGKYAAGADVIHLLTEYNTEVGGTYTATTIMQPANFPNFVKWMYARVGTLTGLMTERSQKFQLNVTGKEISRHTPYEMQKVYLYSKFLNDMDARVLADTFNYNFLKFADVEAVNYWQSIDTPDEIQVTPSYIDSTGAVVTAAAQTISKVIGVIFDQDALGYTVVHKWTATSPFNIRGGYYNTNWVYDCRWYNDFTEKGIVLLLD